jgi:hypothetical protein
MFKKLLASFKALEMSKKLTVVVLIFWILSIIADIVIYLITGSTINDIVDYVNTSFLVILGSYFGTKVIENVTKIKVSDMFKKSPDTTTETIPEENQESKG